MNAYWQKPKVQNLGTGPLNASANVDGVTDFTWVHISSQNRRLTDIANHA